MVLDAQVRMVCVQASDLKKTSKFSYGPENCEAYKSLLGCE
jgi:hypothetical protein